MKKGCFCTNLTTQQQTIPRIKQYTYCLQNRCSGTRALPRSEEPLSVTVEGDPVSVGFFVRKGDGADSPRYVMICNASPCDWARLTLKVNVGEEKLFCVDPKDGVTRELWPVNPRAQLVALSPGGLRLFQIGGEGQGKNF